MSLDLWFMEVESGDAGDIYGGGSGSFGGGGFDWVGFDKPRKRADVVVGSGSSGIGPFVKIFCTTGVVLQRCDGCTSGFKVGDRRVSSMVFGNTNEIDDHQHIEGCGLASDGSSVEGDLDRPEVKPCSVSHGGWDSVKTHRIWRGGDRLLEWWFFVSNCGSEACCSDSRGSGGGSGGSGHSGGCGGSYGFMRGWFGGFGRRPVEGTSAEPYYTNYFDPAIHSNLPIFNIQPQCPPRTALSFSFRQSPLKFQKEVRCVQGLSLWRNNSIEVNHEIFKGYQKGSHEEIINEATAAYDLLDTDRNNYNVTIWYRSPYKTEFIERFVKLVRVPRSVNLVSNAYLQYLQGPGTKMLFEFVKEMPKLETRLHMDAASLIGPLFFTWVILLLFPVILNSLVYENQKRLRIIMKMHGLGDGPYWMISYAYFLTISTLYIICLMIFGSAIGLKFFRLNDYTIQLIFYFICINLQISIAFLVSSAFSKVETASGHWIFVMELFPGFSVYRGLYEFSMYVSQGRKDGMKWKDFSSSGMDQVYPARDGNQPKMAVQGLSLAVPSGECFGMLGPNGAGKTSFINMMTGLTKPTSGAAFVRGLDICKDMDRAYTSMGVCPQHDLLWETLTGREHLLFYGRLKNLKGSDLNQAVEESLKSVNLFREGVADKPSGTYSGGMKRRLSVAISLIGSPKVVYMDEPSTGLDPASRMNLWTVIKRAKKRTAIILTTHSMEEAEFLCDRLGIFVDGRLKCIGNPKELKGRYGGSYVFTMTTTSEHDQDVEMLVQDFSPNAKKIYHLGGTQKFELPKKEVRISEVFQAVEKAKSCFKVFAWGLADTTLEDVFIKVATCY
ncbi:hypothetical protein AALP_AA3G296400 [Arabis alpina]|uniref:ABC transporter domain-containing protein n=1 Tax=Arabis alpina TaxID=50452 RepID=A0A087HCJ9_ARAAL|nr:hypothetical protein AALP_AA3G296400 [Arabis alpina]